MGSFDDGLLVDALEGTFPERQIVIYSRNKETEIYRGIYAGLPYCYVDDILLEAVDCYLVDGVMEIVVDCDAED